MNYLSQKPILLPASKAHKSGQIKFDKAGNVIIKLKNLSARVPRENQFDLTQATIFGLNERLTQASTSPRLKGKITLRDQFNKEWVKYQLAIDKARGFYFDYGVYAYYQSKNHLVRYCEPFWHKVVSVASNSMLLADEKHKLSWREIRNIFDKATVGVVGASVGNSILHTIVQDMRPDHIKIADKSLYKLENINRVRLTYETSVEPNSKRNSLTDSLLRNKAIVTAEQVYAIDPFINVHAYSEGLNESNLKQFFDGGKNEPKIDILVEEVDDPELKTNLRVWARKKRIPLIMMSDFGSNVQGDISRYDLDAKLPLSYGSKDKDLLEATKQVFERPGEKAAFFEYVDALVGTDYRTGELDLILNNKCEIPTSTIIPQLGSTIAVAAGIAGEAVARIALGWKHHPKRFVFNKRDFTVKIYR